MRRLLSWALGVVWLFAPIAAQTADLQATTFNTGLARILGIGVDLVPHVDERLEKQIQVLGEHLQPPFVLLLQEIWPPAAQRTYRKWAASKGYHVAGIKTYRNGLMIISSEPITAQSFHPFKKNPNWRKFGILEAQIQWEGQPVRLLDAHTVFSPVEKPSELHLAQLTEIARATYEKPGIPSVLGGDFNAGPDLSFTKGKYDPVTEIWQKSFTAHLHPDWSWMGRHMSGVTWDQKNNPLAAKPSKVLKYFGALDEDGSWGHSDSLLDHIWASPEFQITEAGVALDAPIEIAGGSARLSDHYACRALLSLK